MDATKIAKKFQEPEENLLMDIATLAAKTVGNIDLSIGDPDLITDERITTKAYQDALAGHTKYTASDGSAEFIRAVVHFYQNHYNLTIKPNQVRGTVGAMHGMFLALQAILDPGDEVIIHEPYFSPYKEQVLYAQGKPVFIPTFEKDEFQIDVNVLEAAITEKTKAIIVNSPNNPTGAVFSNETFAKIAEVAIKHDLFILSDEVYEAFAFYDDFKPMASFAPNHTITFSGFSKAFAMTGWRMGYMIAPDFVNKAAKLINENVTYSAPSLSQQAGIYALNHADELLPEVVDVFKERLEYIEQRVAEIPYLSMNKVRGSMYAYINVAKTGMDSVDFVKYVLKEAQIILIPGVAFGETTGHEHVRLAATQNLSVLEEAFDRLAALEF